MGSLFEFGRVTAEEIADLALISRFAYSSEPANLRTEGTDGNRWTNVTGSIGLPSNVLGGTANNAKYVPITSPGLDNAGEAVVYRGVSGQTDSSAIVVAFEGTGEAQDILTSWIQQANPIPTFRSDAQIETFFGTLISTLKNYATSEGI